MMPVSTAAIGDNLLITPDLISGVLAGVLFAESTLISRVIGVKTSELERQVKS